MLSKMLHFLYAKKKVYIFSNVNMFLIVDIHPKTAKKYIVDLNFNIRNDFLLV